MEQVVTIGLDIAKSVCTANLPSPKLSKPSPETGCYTPIKGDIVCVFHLTLTGRLTTARFSPHAYVKAWRIAALE